MMVNKVCILHDNYDSEWWYIIIKMVNDLYMMHKNYGEWFVHRA